MRYLLTISICFSFYLADSQFNTLNKDTSGRNFGEFREGMTCGIEIETQTDWKQWQNYLVNNLMLSDSSLEAIPPGAYTVIVQFVIDPKGRMSDVSVVKDPGYGLGKRARDVVSKYKGKWTPAQSYGHATYSYQRQPITFLIEEEKEECEIPLPAELML